MLYSNYNQCNSPK